MVAGGGAVVAAGNEGEGRGELQNVRNQVVQNEVQNPGVQNVGNQNGIIVVPGIANPNANQIRNGLGHYVRNCTAKLSKRDAAFLQTRLLIAQKEEAWIQLQTKEFDFMAAAGDLEEIEEVNANCILMANLQQASTSGTRTDSAPTNDSDGSAEKFGDRFVAPCFVNGLEAYDGEINLGVEKNMISNEYAVKLCLEHEVKRGNKAVKKELIVALRDIEEEEEKSNDYWDHLFDFNIDSIPLLGEEGLSPFVCKMGKNSRNKKRAMENLNFFYQDIGTSSSAGGHLTQEEAAKEAVAIKMSRKFTLLEEKMPIIKAMTYHDKYKKILDEVWKDKVELDGKIVKEEEELTLESR
ncbi:hypothetical protein Tco_0047479 [Tanacetum coccineum]